MSAKTIKVELTAEELEQLQEMVKATSYFDTEEAFDATWREQANKVYDSIMGKLASAENDLL
jgi:hypothetical protein